MIRGKNAEESGFVKMLIAIIIFILVLIVTVVVLIYLKSVDKGEEQSLFGSEERNSGSNIVIKDNSDNEDIGEKSGDSGLTPPPLPS
jgi:uncharacterized membrane protein